MKRPAFDAAMKIWRLLPRELVLHIGFEIPVNQFEKIIEEAINTAAQHNVEPTGATSAAPKSE